MKKTQIGWVFIVVLPIVAIIIFMQDPEQTINWLVLLFFTFILLLFYKLTITIDDQHFRYSFGIGLIHGKYLLRDIEAFRKVTYFPLGWGIRFRPGVTLYNVSGNKAVELQIRNKSRRIWIGTDSPDEVVRYLASKLQTPVL
jgi:hypothetical protein